MPQIHTQDYFSFLLAGIGTVAGCPQGEFVLAVGQIRLVLSRKKQKALAVYAWVGKFNRPPTLHLPTCCRSVPSSNMVGESDCAVLTIRPRPLCVPRAASATFDKPRMAFCADLSKRSHRAVETRLCRWNGENSAASRSPCRPSCAEKRSWVYLVLGPCASPRHACSLRPAHS